MKNFFKEKVGFLLGLIFLIIFLFLPLFSLTESKNNFNYFFNQVSQETPSIIEQPEEKENVLVFGGDIMLSRTVNSKMVKYGNYSWPFLEIANIFREADLAIANLESPFLKNSNYHVPSGSFSFKADPQSVSGLVLAGFDVLSLANNHILNQGKKGVEDTKEILSENKISFSGLTENNVLIKESKGVKFSFLSYTYNNDSKLIANLGDLNKLQEDIAIAKQNSDFVIVMMHAGTEYVLKPNKQQQDFAHAAIDYGADLVIGHHPHWPQVVENYQNKTIIYSLGNLIFDQMWSEETSSGILARIFFKETQITRIEYIPITIKDYGQAQLMPEGEKFYKIINNLNSF